MSQKWQTRHQLSVYGGGVSVYTYTFARVHEHWVYTIRLTQSPITHFSKQQSCENICHNWEYCYDKI